MSEQPKEPTQSYRELIVWQKGMSPAKSIYRRTARFPNEEKFGLISQMRRAPVSIPSNLAEGQARRTAGEFVRFISHAEGSIAELDTQPTLAVELGFCPASDAVESNGLIQETRKMLNALRRSVSTHNS
jgi:four helix bundle protein